MEKSDEGPSLPLIKIVEQPKNRVRFRYKTEHLTLLKGENSKKNYKSYVTIRIENYVGRAKVMVSCVATNSSKKHIHTLVGTECKDGVCVKDIDPKTMTVSFIHFGIERAKKNSFSTADNIGMDTNAVRLYFQVNLLDYKSAGSSLLLAYSCPIVDSNRNRNLTICSLSKTKCPVEGGKERYIFCEKIGHNKDIDVRIRDCFGWQTIVQVQPSDIHKGVVVKLSMPPYRSGEIEAPVKCYVQLHRKTDETMSNSLEFEYTPKKKKMSTGSELCL